MSESDLICQSYLIRYVLPLFIIIICWKYFGKYIQFSKFHDKIVAYVTNRIALSLNKSKYVSTLKEDLFQPLHYLSKTESKLKIVEIGAGSGANFKYYPDNSEIICVEPNGCFNPYFRENLPKRLQDKVKFVIGRAEDMGKIKTGSVDAVVCTLVLCSVDDQAQSLAEIKRILKPGRNFYFFEHVAAPSGLSKLCQYLIKGLWWRVGHCRTFSDTKQIVKEADFSSIDTKQCRVPVPIFVRFMKFGLVGTATK
ncbi:DgyrCDS4836 [Dimorphilus gyrociliatus]|uniref:DgyrCDS4836 n=1 Tax=Dimorphilus gyrociliatus TaxID=2664684 RepID=A0A7I8VJK4_9ANNE|nr:DgyrCDS4836 [Dimorphilus gyrociliatus]